jgi:hypothetical protein
MQEVIWSVAGTALVFFVWLTWSWVSVSDSVRERSDDTDSRDLIVDDGLLC